MKIELLMLIAAKSFGVLVHRAKGGRSRKRWMMEQEEKDPETDAQANVMGTQRTRLVAPVTQPLRVLGLWEEGWGFILVHIFSTEHERSAG